MFAAPDPLDPAVVLRGLLSGSPKLTLAVAESVTCGWVQAGLGAISGASDYFLGGITAYTLAAKVHHLGVDAVEAERTNSVSALIAREMAVGVCRLFGSDLGISTTGYAEPDPARGVAHPGAFWAVARVGEGPAVILRQGYLEGEGMGRVAFQRAVTRTVLNQLVDYVRLFRAAESQSKFS